MSGAVGDESGQAPPPPSAVVGFPQSSNAGIRALAAELRARRRAFVTAMVVRAEPPTSAKPGDVAVVREDGTIEGFVGGECAEASVQLQALRALEDGQPVLLRITPGAAESGESEVAEHGTVTVHNPCLSGGTIEIFLEPDLPPPVIVVHGGSPIARALVALAERAGYAIGPVAGQADSPAAAALSADELVAGANAVVVASHGRGEEDILASAARAGVPYIGLVASRRRGSAVLDRLELPVDVRDRIHTPAGLDIGARGPQEIAVSILAEIVAETRRDVPRGRAVRGGSADEPSEAAVTAATSPRPPTATATSAAVDPVCGMAVAVLASSLFIEHDGERYYFCGPGCRDAFLADPEGLLAHP